MPIPDNENVARALFSPKMIVNGEMMESHAGIFVSYKGENIIGGCRLSSIELEVEQDFMLLAIQRELVELAQKGLNKL